ncbi:MAG: TonB-dependent receptor [Sphingobium sp.]|uniref:TonB-dependent receptor n=1 Tax=Sphingobium sp. TaxID=1912891 RepID=UPI000C3569C8|nr:TonB-dependent receptor [Sphingobium sp.]MBU0660084.1 TonB-dependent receptor [Alphaproteobacteria bacterium]MBA4755727.1 TonB-dependent receptor [Sphingobium sp.]MBS91053.1 TonB-dependent receptor [Sphingobium sp.]MBU1795484.1 TonB-dependent receptor [Alphaproteobacteria bacterium]TAJ79305.1 MAG: TonB-dependent receptor [Sphingobium sp.]
MTDKSLWLTTAGMIALTMAMPAAAQETTAPQAAVDQDSAEIIVTATRRASPLSDVPIAVSAVSAQAMQNSGASDIRTLNQLAPSLLVSSTGSEANASARIRGIGTVGDNPGLESSVAVFIDGVYRSRTGAGLNELGEIERVEVLRGPQGTLFGRNASAGLINIISKAPENTFSAKGEITYGNYDYWRLSGRVTGPVADGIALSLDGVWSKRDGFYKLVDTAGNKVGDTNDRDRYFLRGQALIEPNDDLSIRLIGDYTNRDESCCGAAYTEARERTPAAGGGYNTAPFNRIAAILAGQGSVIAADPYDRELTITPGRDYVSKLKDWGVSGEVNYDLGDVKLTSITAYRDYKSSDYGDYDYNRADLLYRDPNTYRQFKTFTQELRAQGSAFGDMLDWLVGGYYANERLTLQDNIRFGADYGRFAACRLMAGAGATSNFPASTLAACGSGLATGALITGTQANLNAGLNAAFLNAGLPAPVAAGQAAAISTGLGNGLRALAAIPSGTGDIASIYRQKSENWALFTHNIVHITNRLDLTLGLRYTHESKTFSADFNNNNATCAALQPGLAPIATNPALGSAAALAGGILTLGCLGNGSTTLNALDLNDKISDGEFSGTAVLSWKATDDLMVYGSYSKGYKAGGFNLDRFQLGSTGLNVIPAVFAPRTNADVTSLRFAAEKVDSFEVGLKYSAPKWSVNLAGFRQEFKNFQLNTFNGTSFVVQNINGCDSALSAARTCAAGDVGPGLISQGVELEWSVTPARNFRVAGGATYAEAKFANRLVGSGNGAVPLDPALFLLPGSINSNAPKMVTTASMAWTPDIGTSGLSALFYVDGRLTSDYNTGSDLFPEKRQDGFAIVNARVGIRGPNQRWAVEFWGQNIFNQDYTQVSFSSPLQSSSPATSTTGQFAAGAPMANQLISSYLAEPRTYGITLRGSF